MKQESWLSGPIEGVPRLLMPAAHALKQAAEDLIEAVKNLTNEELWENPNGAPSVGFHLQHIAGSIERLLTYARAESLTPEQLKRIETEGKPRESVDAQSLAATAVRWIEAAIGAIGSAAEESLFEKRSVGRKKLPTNVFGLLFHIAEHTQRHTGQAITTARIVKRKTEN